jgi:hypothetical protein
MWRRRGCSVGRRTRGRVAEEEGGGEAQSLGRSRQERSRCPEW